MITKPQGSTAPTGSQSSRAKRERNRTHTPRPSNSFILYRREKHAEITANFKGPKGINNNIISKIVAAMWKSETPEIKEIYAKKAEEEKKAHMLKYPDYKYRPKK
ncbi:mating-type protein Mat a-1, partial [Polychytrium aggregatum]|uniref:mating-type protein Mat a-1 n=1 Tax=Polychytrium aggregatum TaxID=110093 RepID=UPI0022FE423F